MSLVASFDDAMQTTTFESRHDFPAVLFPFVIGWEQDYGQIHQIRASCINKQHYTINFYKPIDSFFFFKDMKGEIETTILGLLVNLL